MCITPTTLANGKQVSCRYCWQCVERATNDWVGRCIAESKTSVATHSITLTYGPDESGNEDHLRARLLTYSDVQKYLKYLRADGFPVRYLAVGEYGSTKGRAHWHLIVFWQDKVPEHQLNKRFNEKHWPHGFSHWELPQAHAVRYVCKYIRKEMGPGLKQGHFSMSKKPPLGAKYLSDLAGRYVAQGLAPQDLEYRFSESRDRQGKKQRYVMSGVTADMFLQSFLDQWREAHGTRWWPNSELVNDFWEAQGGEDTRLKRDPFYDRPAPVERTTYGDIWWDLNLALDEEWQEGYYAEKTRELNEWRSEEGTGNHGLPPKK